MKNSNLIIFIIAIALLISCAQENNEKVIEAGVNHIFKTVHFADDYYNNPLKIVKSKNTPPNLYFYINGLRTELVNEKPNSKIINNWKHPLPYLEILELKNIDRNKILLKILFRTTGNEFEIYFKKQSDSLKVDSVSHGHI